MIGSLTALCCLSLPLAVAAADDVEAQLGAMQERMSQLEDRLEATEDQLARANERLGEQRSVLEKAVQTGPSSGVTAFLESLEIGGWVSASYWYNFNDPSNDRLIDANVGTVGQSHPFSPDANQFSFDQLWFETRRTGPASSPRSPTARPQGCSPTATRHRTEGPAAITSMSLRPTLST
jgi:hypothetical protein